jgi:hypothetical protein
MAVNFADEVYLFTLRGSLTCHKILRHGADDFSSPMKEVVLQRLLPLNICRPRPGLKPRTLGPMSSTITTRPPRPTMTLLDNMPHVVSTSKEVAALRN